MYDDENMYYNHEREYQNIMWHLYNAWNVRHLLPTNINMIHLVLMWWCDMKSREQKYTLAWFSLDLFPTHKWKMHTYFHKTLDIVNKHFYMTKDSPTVLL